MIKDTKILDSLIKKALADLDLSHEGELNFEHPSDQNHGDWSSNIALILFKKQNFFKSPKLLAEAILGKIPTPNSTFAKVEVAGPGFINFTYSKEFLLAEIAVLIENRATMGKKINQGKKAIVEFSSPNIAKPFTIGHLRSSIIGWAIANLLEETGYEVFRDNHLGDWGTQFGKQIYALKNLGAGNLEANMAKIVASPNPVKELVALYVEFHEKAELDKSLEDAARAWFKKLEDGDPEARGLWQKCIDWSLVEFGRIYKQLGISFTENGGKGYGESDFEDKMDVVIAELEAKKTASPLFTYETGENGAKVVMFAPESNLPPLMILKSDGATLYATRDLATDKWRLEEKYGKDTLVINEVGAEQSLYFQQLFYLEEALGWVKPGQRVHVGHGMYRFKDGKMSTRKGNVIWLEEVLAEAKKRATVLAGDKQVMTEEQVEKVAFGALKWADLKRNARLDVAFDWDEIMAMQGNSGPYLQYTVVRCGSILAKAQNLDITNHSDLLLNIKSYLKEPETWQPSPEELALVRNLTMYFEVVGQAAAEYAPHYLATYLFSLAQSFNQFYGSTQVLGGPKEREKFLLSLVTATNLVLTKGLGILGIEVVAKM